ncbi:hypothetical protein CLU93_4463 [Janthinobacterium sp. 35]|uniref:hypothetical protein n=1 Tax=Janthinobacterium sp. 35 TaxID=2035210 RepID=UPI000C1A3008|nr:hypothetical protein [Janthinobacterium sp. 35]PIG30128.1 hypothetical protein CLU93_4463 [Janthinobacterium sp. 35]
MPTFTFTGPDGKKYSVAGPEGATEQQAFQMLQTQLGTADSAPVSAPSKPAAAPPQAKPLPAEGTLMGGAKAMTAGAGTSVGRLALGAQRLLGKWYGVLGDATSSSTPSMADLVTGNKPQPNMLARAGKWLVDDADAGRARLTAELAPYKEAYPIATGTGEVGGDILATLPVGGAAVKGGAKLMQMAGMTRAAPGIMGTGVKAAQAAGIGAAYGGVMGAAQSKADTFAGTLGDAATGAATSAALGGVASPITGALGAVAGNVKQRFSQSSALEYAKQKVAEAIARDARGTLATGGYVNPLAQVAARFGKLGDEAVLTDAAGRNTNQLLDTLATLPGRTKESVYNLQRQRTAGVGERMRSSAEKALDTQGQRLPTTVDALIARRTQDSAPLYAQLRNTDIAPSPQLVSIIGDADRLGALALGRKIATGYQQPFLMDVAPPAGNSVTNKIGAWRMNDLDHVKQGLDDLLKSSAATRPDGTVTALGRSYTDLRTKLINELDAATTNPQTGASLYRDARNAFSQPSSLIDAANAGKKAINQGEAGINTVVRNMSDNELQAFRIGAFEGLREKLGTQGGQTNIMNMWKEPATQEKLRAIFGSQRAYREFAADVAKEAQLKRIQSVGVGSQTAARLAGMGDMDTRVLSEAGSSLASAKAGNPLAAIGAAKNVWNRVAVPESVRNQMGAMLLSRGAEGQQNMNAIVKIVQQLNDRNLMLNGGVGALAGQAGGSLSGNLSTPVRIQQQ